MKDNPLIEFVTLMLRGREIPEEVLQNVPVYIKRAVIKLQRRDLLPPITEEFLVSSRKREHLTQAGENDYYYFLLPEDFREMDEWYVNGKSYYQWTDSEARLKALWRERGASYYTIRQMTGLEEESPQTQLILYPFPEDTDTVTLRYYVDGSEVSLTKIKEKYWEAILQTVEVDLGLRDSFTVNDEINDTVRQEKHKQGINPKQGTTLRRPSYFGAGAKVLKDYYK